MAKQTTLWTALPNGYSDDGTSLRLSLLLTPRLEPDAPDAKLEDFPDFVDWPATLAQARFVVHFGAGPAVTIDGDQTTGPSRIDDRLGLPDSIAWTALLPDTTFVRGYEYRDLSTHAVLSYPAAEMDALVQGLYGELAAKTLDQLPTISSFLSDAPWERLFGVVSELDRQFSDRRTGVRRTRDQFSAFRDGAFNEGDLRSLLARFQLFHTPPSRPRVDKYAVPADDAKARAEWLGFEQTALPKPEEFRDVIDFHQIAAAMNQYPTLLRRLGLVLDLVVPRDAFSPAPNALLWVEVELPPGAPGVVRAPDASPRTHVRLDRRRFQPVPRPSPQPGDFRVADGLLDLDPATFALVQADVDGAGLKVTNFVRSFTTMSAALDDPVTKKKREAGAPALRNAGLMLVHKRRADMLKNAVARQGGFNAAADARAKAIEQGNTNPPPPPELFAEDVVRGYRIDIWDDVSRRWRSLCQRRARYEIAEGEVVVEVDEEEGTVRLAATTSPDPGSNPDVIWLHEVLTSWAGWSLSAPPPGRSIHHQATGEDEDGETVVVHEDPVGDPEAEVPPGLRLESAFRALPGTLPRLRYGRRYWLRARVVDLASNSLDLRPDDFGPEHPKDNARPYFRYEPITAPAIALVKPTPGTTDLPAEGESMERLAIRSFNDKPEDNAVESVQRARRFAVPNRTSAREAEHHGRLDRAGVVDPAFFAMLAAKDDSLAEEKVSTAGPLAEGAPVETGYAVLVDGDALPYIPDPLAVEVAARLFDHPSFPADTVIPIPFYDGTEWPDALPFKVEIFEDAAATTHYDPAARTLFVPLPKAGRVTLRLSVRPTAEALKLLGVWNWLTPAQQQQSIVVGGRTMTLEQLAGRGQHWMLTPWRNLELIHAVQRPLITPELLKLAIVRNQDDTFAQPHFAASCSIASTDRVDLRATWNEPFEDVAKDVRENRPRIDHAFSVKITDVAAYAGSHEYFPIAPDQIGVGPSFHDRQGSKVHEFHDTRYRRIEYWLEATSKFREFLPASLLTEVVGGEPQPTEEHIRVMGPKSRTWVLASAPAPAPEVLYMMPTFGWVRSGDANFRSSWRRGGGLRVYLGGSWNASGYGEMLAVVLPPANLPGDPNDVPQRKPLKNFVTQWGNDPIWLSPLVPGVAPRRENFPLARTSPDPDGKWLPSFAPAVEADQPPGPFPTTGLRDPEMQRAGLPVTVEVAPHDVFWDDERGLWYCDIEVTWNAAYFPFIRLALARYQPGAIPSAHLSNIVLADFMPLVPDRWLNVTRTDHPRTRVVRVFGHTYDSSSSHEESRQAQGVEVAPSSVVEVRVERLEPSLGEDFGWRPEPHAIVQSGLAAPKPGPLPIWKARASDLLQHREFEAILDEDLLDHIHIAPTLWKGSVTLPEAPRGTRFRLAISEYEEYLVDDADPYEPPLRSKGRRLVFVEHVELD